MDQDGQGIHKEKTLGIDGPLSLEEVTLEEQSIAGNIVLRQRQQQQQQQQQQKRRRRRQQQHHQRRQNQDKMKDKDKRIGSSKESR